jgi:GntR family transcriptional regulator
MIKPLNHESVIPLYAQAELQLREIIQEQEFQDGKLLPDEMQLAEMMGVSRNTIRQAMDRLVNEGLLTRKKGVGTRVAIKTITTKLDQWMSFSGEMTRQGVPIENIEVKISRELPSSEIATFFEIPLHQPILKVLRVRQLDRSGLVLFTSWLHPRLPLTGIEEFKKTPFYEIIEKKAGLQPLLSDEEISARGADQFESKHLQMRQGAHVLVRKRRVYDDQQRPMEFSIAVYNAEFFSYAIKIKRPFS